MTSPLMRARNLSCRFGAVDAVHDISLDVYAGQVTAVIGHNDSGKTTLLRILAGMVSADSTELTINGQDVSHNPEALHQHVGWVPSDLGDCDNLHAQEMLHLFAQAHFLDPAAATERVDHLVTALQLQDDMHRPLGDLSAVQRYRVAIARALLHNPDVLLLDEPTTQTGPDTTVLVWRMLTEFTRKGMGVVVTARTPGGLADFADETIHIQHGRNLQCTANATLRHSA